VVTQPKRPKVRKPKPWTFPRGHRLALPNGLQVLLYPRPGQFVVSAGLCLDLPLTSEPVALEGVAALTARTLDEGTASRPGTRFADAVEACGAVLGAEVGYAHTEVVLDVPGAHLAEALGLLAEAVLEPQLTDADVARHRTLRVAQIEQQLATGSERANHALRRALIHPRCRASRMRSGEPDSLARVSGEDVRAFHAGHFGPVGATLVLAGDFGEAVLDVVAETLGAWANPDQRFADHETPTPREPSAYLIDRPGSVQADVRWGWNTIDRSDPRWADLQLAGNAIGGAYLSRLNRVLREEKGFTYGASLVSAPMRHGGYTYAQGSFRNEVVGDALALMPSLVDTATHPITDEEVTRARDSLTGVTALRYATAAGVCHGVLSLVAVGLTTDFVDAQLEAYRRATPESVTAVASELIRPDAGALVVVGDAGALERPLREAGWEPRIVATGEWV